MKFINDTDMPAALVRTILPDQTRLMGVVVAKSTYSYDARGAVWREMERQIPVSKRPMDTEYGQLPGDHVPFKHGVDVFAFGNAYAPGGHSTSSWVSFKVGAFERRLAVHGDRYWRRSGRDLVATAPRPFDVIPLTWSNAYGGKVVREGNELPHAYNDMGKGYVLLAEDGEGVPLPNVEDPDQLLRGWNDRPIPMTFAPVLPNSQYAADEMVELDPATGQGRLRRLSFNAAHPKMRLEALQGSEMVELGGMSREGIIRFQVPREQLCVHVSLAERHYTFPVQTDTLGVLVPYNMLFLVHRCRFVYSFIRREIRIARLARVN